MGDHELMQLSNQFGATWVLRTRHTK